MIINGAWLTDGSFLTVALAPNIGGPTDRRCWAIIEYPDGSHGGGWECLDTERQFTSMPEVRSNGVKVMIDALSTPKKGDPVDSLDDYWCPYRNVYVHDPTFAKPFLKRFSGWKPLGDATSRLRPTVPPLP